METNREINKRNIILGSASPRRQMLLKALGISFNVSIKQIDETNIDHSIPPEKVVLLLAKNKSEQFPIPDTDISTIIITADTIVVLDGKIIGKPASKEEAESMLKALSGNMHIVHTGVCIKSSKKTTCFIDTTKVWFKDLSDEAIEQYVALFKPYDKAGGYGIQEWVGYAGVEKIEGSFFNVMGLPTHRVYDELLKF